MDFVAELSGFEVFGLVKEIESAARGSYVNNIYSLGRAQILRLRRPGGEDVWVVCSPTKGVWVSAKVTERGETSEFTSKLRKRLERLRFAGAAQVDLDRVFELSFTGVERADVIVELMPPGNLVLTGERKVLLAEREVRSPARRLVRGGEYLPPTQKKVRPDHVDEDGVKKYLSLERTVGSAIGKHISLPRKYVAEALARLSVEEKAPTQTMEGRESEMVRTIRGLAESARDPHPCICATPDGDEIFSFVPRAYPVKKEASSFSSLCDDLFLPEILEAARSNPTPEEDQRREAEATLSKLKAEEQSVLGEAAQLRALADQVRAVSGIEAAVDLLRNAGVESRREPRSTHAAASLAYDKAKALDDKASAIRTAIERLEKKAHRRSERIEAPQKKLARRKEEWYQKFRWFSTSEGKLAVGGRDAHSNSILIRRHLDGNDSVYHADLFGSPFFVLKGGLTQSEGEVRELAQATVSFSSAWKTGLGSADAYWIQPGQVSSAAPSGEYLPKGSFAIVGNKHFVRGSLVEVAVGIDGEGRVVSGPESAISRVAVGYAVLRPHNEKSSETAKKLAKALAGPDGPSIDDFLRALPAGGGKIVRTSIKSKRLSGD